MRNPKVLGRWGKGAPRVLAKNWGDPLKWNKDAEGKLCCTGCGRVGPSKTWLEDILKERKTAIACCPDNAPRPYRPAVFPSFCDWLDDEVSDVWLERFLRLIHDTPNVDWLLLTKRPENFHSRIRGMIDGNEWDLPFENWVQSWRLGEDYPKNVWIGTSVEDQQRAVERIPALQAIPAKLRFLSVEPLLGRVDLRYSAFNGVDSCAKMHGIHWVIVGGESGPKSRSCNVDWIRSILRQCEEAKVPCFVKQLGARVMDPLTTCAHTVQFNQCWPDGTETNGHHVLLTHPKGGAPSEWPEDLRRRQFPGFPIAL